MTGPVVRLRPDEQRRLADVVRTHHSASAVKVGRGDIAWVCSCGQPLAVPNAPAGAVILDLQVHLAVTLDDLIEVFLSDRFGAILDQCDRWDKLSKGESPTTQRIRAIVSGQTTGATAAPDGRENDQ